MCPSETLSVQLSYASMFGAESTVDGKNDITRTGQFHVKEPTAEQSNILSAVAAVPYENVVAQALAGTGIALRDYEPVLTPN